MNDKRKKTNPSVLSERYATSAINEIFSEFRRNQMERDFWIMVLKSEKGQGVDISQDDIDKFIAAKDDIDLDRIKEIEAESRHDINAKIKAFVEKAGAKEIIHRPLTSRDLSDNIDQAQIILASKVIFGKFISILRYFIEKAILYNEIPIAGRSHDKPAQPILLGKRFAMWAEELLIHLLNFEKFLANYPLRGIKGPMGTQSDMLNLLGDHEKVKWLEQDIANEMGFTNVMICPGQVYPRSLDFALFSHLLNLACACGSFATTMRLMSGLDLATEGFKKGQVGSTAMPHKQNPRSSERICGFVNLIKMYTYGISLNAGNQWNEGDVSCSVLRRVCIEEMFYACDGLCETTLTVLNEMGIYEGMIQKELERLLPFLATTKILNLACKKGLGREQAHEIIKDQTTKMAERIKSEGADASDFPRQLANCEEFVQAGITKDDIQTEIQSQLAVIKKEKEQIISTLTAANLLIRRYPREAMYEPEEIL